jgi:hypothetical protein
MANKRITSSSLSGVPVQAGQILRGEHIAILKYVFTEGVNANKHDIDRIIAGDVDAYIFYDTPTHSGKDYLDNLGDVDIGSNGFVVTSKDIKHYTYDGSSWVLNKSISLVDIYDRLKVLETAAGFDTDFVEEIRTMLDSMNAKINHVMLKAGITVFNSMEEADSSLAAEESYAFINVP